MVPENASMRERIEERLSIPLATPSVLPSTGSRGRTTVSKTQSHTSTTSSDHLDEAMDLRTVLKASQAIAGDIILSTLLEKLVNILIENAGADRGFVLLTRNGTTTIEAKLDLREPASSFSRTAPLSSEQGLSVAVVERVSRTHETIVLDHPDQGDTFAECPHIRKKKPPGVLCTPLLNQQELVGVFYLENTLASGAFSPDRLEIVKLIAGHVALSVHNAVLYATLEERVEERTVELQEQNQKLATTLKELRATQGRLVESERLAALKHCTRQGHRVFVNRRHRHRVARRRADCRAAPASSHHRTRTISRAVDRRAAGSGTPRDCPSGTTRVCS